MVRVLGDESVGARIRVKGVGADEMRAGEVMPKMAIDRVNEEQFALLVPIVAPRIGSARAECLHHFAPRMVTPNRTAQRDALLGRSARHAHFARARRAATPIKPAVRTESQT